MRRGGTRVSPEQQAMASGPDPKSHLVRAIFAEKVGVTVAGKTSRSSAQREEPFRFVLVVGHFEFANRGLLVGESHVLGPVFGRERYRHAGLERRINQILIETLGVKIDSHLTPRGWKSRENCRPETIASFTYSTLAVCAQGDPADIWASF